MNKLKVPYKNIEGLIVRASPHYKTGTEEIIGYAPVLVKTIQGRMPCPPDSSSAVKSVFNNNTDISSLCYVRKDGDLSTTIPVYFDAPEDAIAYTGLGGKR